MNRLPDEPEDGPEVNTVPKRRRRAKHEDRKTGPAEARSTVRSKEDEAMIAAFRRHTLMPLDDCLYALQTTIPHLTRSSLHRCLQRHGISRLTDVEGDKPAKKTFKCDPIGYVHIAIAELRTGEGKLRMLIARDRASKLALVHREERATSMTPRAFLEA